MEIRSFVIVVSLFTVLIGYILFRRSNGKKLPPGPSFLSSNFLLLTNPRLQLEPVLINLKARYSPFFTLSTCFGPAIFVANHSLAHQVLVKKGAIFSDRPKSFPMRNISSASYGPTWRLFHRNLASEFMHPSRIKSYSWARQWVLQVFFGRLQDQHDVSGITVVDHIGYAMFYTTSTALQWIMANLVKYPHIQRKLYEEIVGVVGPPPPPPQPGVGLESVINEEDIKKMPYLKAVVLEGLRRHPPFHFVLPHRVMKEVEVEGYMIPEGATINFMVGEMGLDPKVWDDPMEFKPERFLVNDGVFDMSGSKGIKMMPFGAGRRICPGYDMALFHLEYFVANSIWYFDWTVPDGYDVDFSEEVELTVVMKNPLRAQISSREEKGTT
ncbi:hypothetical protein L1987_87114 [Smallanthus sonchifolius]|nr:hypothetical protein L1987_87114 [Smallanthus sonchifolius]